MYFKSRELNSSTEDVEKIYHRFDLQYKFIENYFYNNVTYYRTIDGLTNSVEYDAVNNKI